MYFFISTYSILYCPVRFFKTGFGMHLWFINHRYQALLIWMWIKDSGENSVKLSDCLKPAWILNLINWIKFMVLSICKFNRTIWTYYFRISGFFSAMNYFAVFLASLRVTENYILSSKLPFYEMFTNMFRFNILNTFPFCYLLL